MKQRCNIKGKTSNFQTTIEDYIKYLLPSIVKNSLIIHPCITILHLLSRKSSGDGRLAAVLENLLPMTINPSMTKLHQSSKPNGINLVVMDGITLNFAINSFIIFMFKATFYISLYIPASQKIIVFLLKILSQYNVYTHNLSNEKRQRVEIQVEDGNKELFLTLIVEHVRDDNFMEYTSQLKDLN